MAVPTFRVAVLFLAFLAACTVPRGGAVQQYTSDFSDYPAFLQACKDATTDAVVMNLAAHPDDESGRSLVFLRRKFGVRTVTVYSTCGEGGQNAIGREIGMDLARLRTRETLAAARLTGTQVRWLGFADFGYSKTAAEAFKVWGKDTYLRRLSAIVDEERPDLVLTNHSPGGGHGHHRASSIALRELLAAKAKDGWVVPIYERASRRRPASGASRTRRAPDGSRTRRAPGAAQSRTARRRVDADIKFDVGEVDYMTGLTYSRQASRAWREHRTQGMGGGFSSARRTPDSWKMVHPENGNGARFFAYLGSVFDEEEFQKVAKSQNVDLEKLAAEFAEFHRVMQPRGHVERAESLLPRVERLFADLKQGGDARNRLARRIDALQRVVLEGYQVKIVSHLVQEKIAAQTRGHIVISASNVSGIRGVLDGKSAEGTSRVEIPFGPLASVDEEGVAPSWFRPQITVDVGGQKITREVPVRYTSVPRVALALKRPVRFVPTAAHGKTIEASVEIVWHGDEALDAPLRVVSANGLDVQLKDASIRLTRAKKTERKVRIRLPNRTLNGDESIVLVLDSGKSELRLRPVDVKAPSSLFIGLIRGPDDTLRLALDDLNIRFEELDKDALPKTDLSKFTTVILDIRAYRTRIDLRTQRDRLLSFCKAGGRMLCFYHKPGEWNKSANRPLLAPYDIQVGRGRVCEEDAKVTLVQPEHRLWNHPNKINSGDFEGWVQERGLNFPSKWAEQWTPLMKMSDTGEKPLEGALLYANYEKGDYIYCSLALYRQLRQGHPGAARILVNLLTR